MPWGSQYTLETDRSDCMMFGRSVILKAELSYLSCISAFTVRSNRLAFVASRQSDAVIFTGAFSLVISSPDRLTV